MVEVKVESLFRTEARASGVLLKEVNSGRMLPIIIGDFEARAIAMSLAKQQTSRPLTFDLFDNIIEQLNTAPERVLITHIEDATYHATLQFRFRSKPCQVNARPSDAFTFAVRHGIPISIKKSLMKASPLDVNKLIFENGDKPNKNKGKEEPTEMLDILANSAFRDGLKFPPAAKLTPVFVEGIFQTDDQQMGVLLAEKERDRKLPIEIGEYEAHIIAMGIENIIPPRPLTHDLMIDTIAALEAKIERVVIDDFNEPDIFYAQIQLYRQPRKFFIDARPSDVVALALKSNAPIFVAKRLMKRVG